MNNLKTLFLLFLTLWLGEQAIWAMQEEEVPEKLCLMNLPTEYSSLQWLPEFTEYCEKKGQQKQRIAERGEYTKSYVRFVKNIASLNVGYGLLRQDKNVLIPELQLKQETYKELAALGTTIKIINGYVQNLDESEQTFTPDKTNILVPHISYIIQWKKDVLPELIPGGVPYTQKKSQLVFMSGGGIEEASSKIKQFYNDVYKDENSPSVSIWNGKKVADKYLPCILYQAVNELDFFKEPYLGKLAKTLQDKTPFTKETKENVLLLAKNTLHCTFHFLALLFDNKFEEIFNNRQDTTRRLLENFLKEEEIKITEEGAEQNKKFNKEELIQALKSHRLKFLEAAFQRAESQLKTVEEDRKLITSFINYMRISLTPQGLKDIEKAEEFWTLIKDLGENIKCPNPDSRYGSLISVAERLKKYALAGFNGSHTEPLFIKLMRAQPQYLTQNLQKIVEDHKENFENGLKPRFLGVIIDAFSWLDTCSNCGNFLHTNTIWADALNDAKYDIELKGFLLPFLHIDSLFRMATHEPYDNAPLDLRNAEGGSDYASSGWDYRVLSELRYTLATRYPTKGNVLRRDKIFERIPNSITKAVLTKPLEFWHDSPALSQIILAPVARDFAVNAIEILFLKFPDNKAIRIKKIETAKEKKKFDDICFFSKSLASEPFELSENEGKFLTFLAPQSNLGRSPNYSKTCFGEACLERASKLFKEKKPIEGWSHMVDLIKLGFIKYQKGINFQEGTVVEVAAQIVNYWKKEWNMGQKKPLYNTPELEDKVNTECLSAQYL